MKTTSCIPLSLYLWRITSWSKMGDLFEGDHCRSSRNFRNLLMVRNHLSGVSPLIIETPRLVLGWFIYFREGEIRIPSLYYGIFSYAVIFWIPFLPTSLMTCHGPRVLITAQVGIGDPDPDDYDTPGNDWHPNRPVGVRSKSYPQKMAIIWGLFDIWSWCPD